MNQLPVISNGAFGRALARFSGASALNGSCAAGACACPPAWAYAGVPAAHTIPASTAAIVRIDLVMGPPASCLRQRAGRVTALLMRAPMAPGHARPGA